MIIISGIILQNDQDTESSVLNIEMNQEIALTLETYEGSL